MNQLIRSNVVAYRRRYLAVIAAVTIGVAFLTATLFVGSSITASLVASAGQTYQNSQLVLKPGYASAEDRQRPTPTQMAERVAKTPGVVSTLRVDQGSASLTLQGMQEYAILSVTDGNMDLFGTRLTSGNEPGLGEVTINAEAAAKAGVGVGSEITMEPLTNETTDSKVTLKVAGIRENSQDPSSAQYTNLQMTDATAQSIKLLAGPDVVLASLTPGTSAQSLAPELQSWLADHGYPEALVGSPQAVVTATVAAMSSGVDILTWVLSAFAGIALVVTVLVVANTFSVILAQRTRELALLRTLGARRGQIRSMVTGEALVVGLVGGLVGVALGAGVVALGAAVVRGVFNVPYATFGFGWAPIVTGVVVGLLVTLFASLRPALAATRVSPLAALRPSETVTVRSKAGTTRVVIGSLLVLAGAAALVNGVLSQGTTQEAFITGFTMSFVGGLVSFIGILVLGTLLIPWAVRQLARPFSSKISGRLAGLNALRHPQRTSAIGTALLLGVTLVALMLAGATSARSTLNAELGRQMPVDLTVSSDSSNKLKADASESVAKVEGVKAVTRLSPVGYTPGCAASDDDSDSEACVYGYAADSADLSNVLTSGAVVPALGSVSVGDSTVASPKPTQITMTDDSGRLVTIPVDANAAAPMGMILMTNETRSKLGLPQTLATKTEAQSGQTVSDQLWVRADESARAGQLVSRVATAAGVPDFNVAGALPLRQTASSIIDTLLMVVSALLAVAVVIALIGVSNTLSLSVLERTKENSLLRALGLTKRQLRKMLALEAALIAGAVAVLGLVLGTIYGLAGARAATSNFGGFAPEVPWLWMLVILVVAVGAAVLASVFPARRAAKLSPVEGLAVE